MIVELTTGILMLASFLSGVSVTGNTGVSSDSVSPSATQSISTESYVREHFKDIPILAEISRCESTFRQYDKNGKPLLGIVNDKDIGVMQINTYYHGETADKLGYDLTTIDGNLGYARYLYGKYGTQPWSSSSKCWKKYENAINELARK